jgi:repressor LexA
VLDALTEYHREHGFMPTVRELADRLGMTSANGAKSHLDLLEKKGYVRRDPKKARAICIL